MDNNKIHIILFGLLRKAKELKLKTRKPLRIKTIFLQEIYQIRNLSKTELGLKALEFMAKGQLVPDDDYRYVSKKVARNQMLKDSYMMDSPGQQLKLMHWIECFKPSGDKISCLIVLDVSRWWNRETNIVEGAKLGKAWWQRWKYHPQKDGRIPQ